MKRLIVLMFAAAVLTLIGCGKDHSDLPTAFTYVPPPTPTGLAADAEAERCTVTWSYPADSRDLVSEFNVYQYYEPYDMYLLIGSTPDTFFVDSMLVGNLYYCYEVSAVDTTGFEGWPTNYVCAFVPTGP
jgi:hypothetical protein